MTETTLRTSGNEVFSSNKITLNANRTQWNYKRLVSAPPLPGQWAPAETDAIGFENPTIRVEGFMNVQNTHAQNKTGSLIDFFFLNEFVGSSGLKYLSDDVLKSSDGSDLLVEVLNWSFSQTAKDTPEKDVRSQAVPYLLNLVVASGTPWYSGTGINV